MTNNIQEKFHKVNSWFLSKTLKARREWQDIFKMMKGKNLQPRLPYPARISFRFEEEIKTFTDKQKLREFSTTKPALQQELLQEGNIREEKDLKELLNAKGTSLGWKHKGRKRPTKKNPKQLRKWEQEHTYQ